MKTTILILAAFVFTGSARGAPAFPETFDALGPTVETLTLASGRRVHYIDDGPASGVPVVFTGGLGTSVRVIRLLDFLRSFRQQLGIRVITVERNGFGQTAFEPDLSMADFSSDVIHVLDHLSIDRFAVFGISGGGPYTLDLAVRNAGRVLSVHMAATSPRLADPRRCAADAPASAYLDMIRNPMAYFGFAPGSPVHQVTGFQDTAFDEAARAHFVRGQMADPAPLAHELGLYCRPSDVDTAMLSAPVFVYHGLADSVLGALDPNVWVETFPGSSVTLRLYPGEGHDVQYRHLDQILLDIAGYGERTLVCHQGRNRMLAGKRLARALERGARVGLCAWSGP